MSLLMFASLEKNRMASVFREISCLLAEIFLSDFFFITVDNILPEFAISKDQQHP